MPAVVRKDIKRVDAYTPGEVIEREQSFALNSIPQIISSLASTYLYGTENSDDYRDGTRV